MGKVEAASGAPNNHSSAETAQLGETAQGQVAGVRCKAHWGALAGQPGSGCTNGT